jgi:hypothetical protein
MLNTFLITGIVLVNAALVLYCVALFFELRGRVISRKVVLLYLCGVTADISATALMIAGSHRIPITLHGVLGYSALLGMIANLVILSRVMRKRNGAPLPRKIRIISVCFFAWWVIVYIAGALLVAGRHH